MKRNMELLPNRVVRDNPVLKLVFGICPALAVTSLAIHGLVIGLLTMVCLISANFIMAMMAKLLPEEVRVPSYVTIVAALVTVVQMLMKAYYPTLEQSLGIFIPLIVVYCMILGRAVDFPVKHAVFLSVLEAVILGFSFTLTLTILAVVREITGVGTCFGVQILPSSVEPFTIMTSSPGGFFLFGLFMAAIAFFTVPKELKTQEESSEGPSS